MSRLLRLASVWMLVGALLLSMLSTAHAEQENQHGADPEIILLFMFFGLGIGILIMQLLSFCGDPLPYTVVIFMSGLIFSLLDKNNAGLFGDSVTQWTNIDADLLLFTFLPPLIFGEAMSLNFYHVKGGFVQALILAGPGVLIGAALMGLVAKYMLPYNWNWNLALTFGSILSATDPVAVVALLKSAGASPKLTILIVGESLMNDGTAMVLFTIFYESLNGRVYTPASVSYFFACAAFGSVFLGLFCGFLIIRWLRTANRPLKEIDTTIQIAITITCAYLIFFTAQYVLKISGVLACGGAGIVLAWLAPPVILSHETMHHVWGMIEWTLNTLIFLLAGLIIGNRVIDQVEPLDWMFVVVLYVLLMLVRSLTICILYPFLSTIGHKCTRNEAIFMSWAGLRGALGMALALIVEHNCPDHLEKETSRLFFYVGGIAALTMVINATTANQLLHYLGLLGNDSAEKNIVMQQIKKRLKRRMDSVLVEMAAEFAFTPQDLDEVRESCSLLADSNLESLYRDSERMSLLQGAVRPSMVASLQSYKQSDSDRGASPTVPQLSISVPTETAAAASSASVSLSSTPAPAAPAEDIRSPSSTVSRSALMLVNPSSDPVSSKTPVSSLFDFVDDSSAPASGVSFPRSVSGASGGSLNVLTKRKSSQDSDYGGEITNELFSKDDAERVRMQRQSRMSHSHSFGRHTNSGDHSHSSRGQRTKSCAAMRADDIMRMLSMGHRGEGAFLQPELLTYVRGIFLEILRVRYWHDIERGKIPRLSHSAKFLLYSIEVGVDEVEEDSGVRDWRVIKKEITEMPLSIRILSYLDANLPHSCMLGYSTYYLGKLEARREKRAVYMLTSFIDAHEHAQSKVHEFIVADDSDWQSPEELKVIEESKQAVEIAQHLLNSINPDTVAKIRAKQAAALVLTKQAELIKNMVEEGLLTPQHAEDFLEDISRDLQRMDKDRNQMYWEQGEKLARKRQALKVETQSDSFAGRYSVFSLFDWQQRRSSSCARAPSLQEGQDLESRLRDSKDEICLGPNSVTAAGIAGVSEPLLPSFK